MIPQKENTQGLSDEILREIKKLVMAQCSNYQAKGPFGIAHYCWTKEKSNAGQCVYFAPNGFCKWFEEAVLPLDEELKEKYFEAKEGGGKEDGGSTFIGKTTFGSPSNSRARFNSNASGRNALYKDKQEKAFLSPIGNYGLGKKEFGLCKR